MPPIWGGGQLCKTNPICIRPEESVGQAPPYTGRNCAKQTQFSLAGREAGSRRGGNVQNEANCPKRGTEAVSARRADPMDLECAP